MKVFFLSFGCKVNQYETEGLKEKFTAEGFTVTEDMNDADVIVVNSCTVTASGDSRSLHALRKAKETRPDAVTVLTGCLPQASDDKEALSREADIVTGTKNRSALPSLVKNFIQEHQAILNIEDYQKGDPFEVMNCTEFQNKTRAFVKIQDGCDRFCSYCLIPYARGRCRSKPLDSVVSEITELAGNGHKEVVLVGINLMFYGQDIGCTLTDAVEAVCAIEGVERVRLGSIEPEMMTDNDLKRLAAQPKFCPQFHLSLQSGCDRTLKAMNRHYTCDEYFTLVEKIRNAFEDPSVTTDIMVGFPDETEEDFAQTMDFAEKVGFARIHVFSYSRRKGTKADRMANQIPERVKTERMKKLRALGDKMTERFNKSLVGKTFPVLFERESDPDNHIGHTPNYTLIKIPEKNFEKSLKKEIFCVTIISGEKNCCIGKIVSDTAGSSDNTFRKRTV